MNTKNAQTHRDTHGSRHSHSHGYLTKTDHNAMKCQAPYVGKSPHQITKTGAVPVANVLFYGLSIVFTGVVFQNCNRGQHFSTISFKFLTSSTQL